MSFILRQVLWCTAVFLLLACGHLAADEPVRHKLLMIDESRSQLLYVDQYEPAKNWKLHVEGGSAWSLQLVGNNRVLLALPGKGGFREYDLATQKVVHEKFDPVRYNGAMSATRFPDGRTVLGCAQKSVRIVVLGPDDKEISAHDFPEINGLRQVRRTERDTLLLGSFGEDIFEVSLDGKILRRLKLENAKFNYQVIELPNGNLLASAGYGGFLAELDKAGKVVRQWGGRPEPKGLKYIFMSHFQTLKNGNIVVATWTGHRKSDSKKGQQVVEFAPDGKVIWKWHDSGAAGSIHGVIVLDDLDTSRFYDDTILTKEYAKARQ
jgi:hypothetical protein